MTLQELYDKDAKLIKEGLKIRSQSSGVRSTYKITTENYYIFGTAYGPSFSIYNLNNHLSTASLYDVIIEIEDLEI